MELRSQCPLAASVKLIGGRWKLILIWYIHEGLETFSKLKKAIPAISEKVLAEQLNQLQADGLVVKVISEKKDAKSYQLTSLGSSLAPSLRELAKWGEENKIPERFKV